MTSAESSSRVRRFIAGTVVFVVALALFAVSAALFLICLAGIGLLVAGIVSWLHPVEVASAWARTLGGAGLIGGSTGIGALGWLGVERLVGPLGRFAHLRRWPRHFTGAVRRTRQFVAVIGILVALICLPFAAAIHASGRAPWLGW